MDTDNSKTRLVLPASFASEAEEAQWWYDHRQDVEDEFARLVETGERVDGPLTRRLRALRQGTTMISIRLADADLALAKQQAQERGLPYQTYLKMLLHEALRRGQPAADAAGPAA